MKNSRLICMIFAAALILAVCFCGCSITNVKIETGECGEDAEWSLSDGVLTVEGSGAVDIPVEPAGEVNTIIVDDGITEIGDKAFKDIPGVSSIELPESLVKIGSEAFSGLKDISEIEIPDAVKDIAGDAFRGWEDSQTIISQWYEGSVENWQEYYDLWKNYSEKLKSFLDDEELREKTQAFANKWSAYIKENYDEFVELYGKITETGSEDILGLIKSLTEFKDEFVNDLLDIIPSIERVLKQLETEGEGIIYEIKGDMGEALSSFYFGIEDAREYIGDSAKDYFSIFKAVLPQYEEGLKSILGIDDNDGSGESEVPAEPETSEEGEKASEGKKNNWRDFWEGLDPETFDIISDALDKFAEKHD